MPDLLHIGIDIDKNKYQISAFNMISGEILNFKSKANVSSLLKVLNPLRENFHLKVCYEASIFGYTLCRQLNKELIATEVIAPSLIPKIPGRSVKTDRIDAEQLAQFYANQQLVPIHIPTAEDEATRNLIRNRGFLVSQKSALKIKTLATCRLANIDYHSECPGKVYWTQIHRQWLEAEIEKLDEVDTFRFDIEQQLIALGHLEDRVKSYDEKINEMAQTPKYQKKVEVLSCFRGIATLTAMKVVTEIGDIKRFKHPKNLTSYCGLDIQEYSSGSKQKKGGITRQGNKHLRTALVESCQARFSSSTSLTKRIRVARQGLAMKYLRTVERCDKRLKKKKRQLENRGKHSNKIKVACAREKLGFIWEALRKVEKLPTKNR